MPSTPASLAASEAGGRREIGGRAFASRALRLPCLAALAMLALAACSSRPASLVGLTEGWSYRWGDSPRGADGVFTWLGQGSEDGWQPISYPSNPPDRLGRRNAWFRVRLPESAARDPGLFVYSIDVNAELYVGEELVYAWGELDESGTGRFLGWPWHLVALPADSAGGTLSVRVYSDYRDIGLWGTILFGPRCELLGRLYARDMPRLAVAAASLLLGLALLAVYFLPRPRDPFALYIALTALSLILRVIARTHVKQLLLDAPVLWIYLDQASAFLVAIFITLVTEQVVGEPFRRIARVAWIATTALFVVSLALSLAGLVRIVDMLPAYDPVMIGLILLLLTLSVLATLKGRAEARVLVASFTVMGALIVYGILVSNNLVAWADETDYLITFAFALAVSVEVARRLLGMHERVQRYAATLETQSVELRKSNEVLERKVAERTRDLELANSRLIGEKRVLEVASITDSLTGMRNRAYVLDHLRQAVSHAHRYGEKLSIVMVDLDHFKDVNDTWGHQAGDDVLKRVAQVFASTFRDSDVAGRYGGEEFLVVLPKADEGEASRVAERLRARIEALEIRAGDHWLTASGGVAEHVGQGHEELLSQADRALYRAKHSGRNRIEGSAAGSARP
jgi:diguanylate cyclase